MSVVEFGPFDPKPRKGDHKDTVCSLCDKNLSNGGEALVWRCANPDCNTRFHIACVCKVIAEQSEETNIEVFACPSRGTKCTRRIEQREVVKIMAKTVTAQQVEIDTLKHRITELESEISAMKRADNERDYQMQSLRVRNDELVRRNDDLVKENERYQKVIEDLRGKIGQIIAERDMAKAETIKAQAETIKAHAEMVKAQAERDVKQAQIETTIREHERKLDELIAFMHSK